MKAVNLPESHIEVTTVYKGQPLLYIVTRLHGALDCDWSIANVIGYLGHFSAWLHAARFAPPTC